MAQTSDRQQERDSGLSASRRKSLITRLAAVVLWLLVWQLASMIVDSKLLLASPIDTVVRLFHLIDEPTFLATVGFSLMRIVGGFLVAYAGAVLLALVAHRWPVVGELCAPLVLGLKSVPIACVIVLLLMWVGSSSVSALAVFLAVFPAVYFSCLEGLANVDGKVSEMLQVFRASGPVRFLAHVWPSTLPFLLGTSKNVCGMAWKAGVAAELIGSPMGSVGERIYQSKVLLETADLFAWTIVVVAVSAVCEQLFVWFLRGGKASSQLLALALARGKRHVERGNELVPSSIVLAHASLGYGKTVVAPDVNIDRGPGSRTVLTDSSGAGKTTMLRTVAGLQPLLAGEALLLPPTTTMVFQDVRLLEHMTAVQNVQLVVGGLMSEEEIRAELAKLLPGDALFVPVQQLSGGQRRRVEIVRALLCPSAAVLLDEPFASLDAQTHQAAARFVVEHLEGRTLMAASHIAGDAELLGADELQLFAN